MSTTPDAASASQTPLPIQAMRLALDLIDQIGPDGFLLFMVIVRAQDEIFFRRGVGFYRHQLCKLCGFPTTTFRRLYSAKQSLIDAGLIQCKSPECDRTQTIYWVGDWTNINRQNGPTEQVTCSQNGLSEQVQCSRNGIALAPKRHHHWCQNGIATDAETASPPVLLPNTLLNPNTPLPPKRGSESETQLTMETFVSNEQSALPHNIPAPAAEPFPNQTPDVSMAIVEPFQEPTPSQDQEAFALTSGSATSKPKRTKQVDLPPIPSELDTPAFRLSWNEFVSHRQALKKPLTAQATSKTFSQLAKWGVVKAIQALDTSIMSGWTGVFEPKEIQPSKGPNNGKSNQPAYLAERYVPGQKIKTGFPECD